MKNRGIRIAAFILFFCVFFCASAFADGGEQKHFCSCGEFALPLSGELSESLSDGSWFLSGDAKALYHIYITGEVNLCLNGFVLETEGATTIHILEGGVLNLYDCGEGAVGYTGGNLNNHPCVIDAGGTLNLYSGHLYAFRNSNCINNDGTVNLYGGFVDSCSPLYSGIRNRGTVNVYGGRIVGHCGILQYESGFLNLCAPDFSIEATEDAIKYYRNDRVTVVPELFAWTDSSEIAPQSVMEQPFVYHTGSKYLCFAPLRFGVSLESAGGSVAEPLGEYICGEELALPVPVREGFEFLGWLCEQTGEKQTVISAEQSGELSFIAQWEKLPQPTFEPTPIPEPEAVPAVQTEPAEASIRMPILAAALLCLAVLTVLLLWKRKKS